MDVEFPALPPGFDFGASYYAGIGIFVLIIIIGSIVLYNGGRMDDRTKESLEAEEISEAQAQGKSKTSKFLVRAGFFIIFGAVAVVVFGGIGNLIWYGSASHNAKVEASRALIYAAEERYGIVITSSDASVMLTGPGDLCTRYERRRGCTDTLNFTPEMGSVVYGDDATLQLADGTMLRVQLVWNEDQWILIRSGDPDLIELPSWS